MMNLIATIVGYFVIGFAATYGILLALEFVLDRIITKLGFHRTLIAAAWLLKKDRERVLAEKDRMFGEGK